MLSRRGLGQGVCATAILVTVPQIALADVSDPYESAWDLIEAGDFTTAAQLLEPDPVATTYFQKRVVRAGALYFAAGDFISAQQCFESALAEPAKTEGTKPDTSGDKPNSFLLLRDASVWRYLAQLRQGQAVELATDVASVFISPLKRLVAGLIDVDTYADEETRAARAFYDALILNVAEWKGKEDFVRRAVEPLTKGYRCAGNFALAEQMLARGGKDEARTLFSAALEPAAVNLLEYHIAKAELARLGASAQ